MDVEETTSRHITELKQRPARMGFGGWPVSPLKFELLDIGYTRAGPIQAG